METGVQRNYKDNLFLMIFRDKEKLPTPRYIVFYNGLEKDGDSMELKLSDAFEMDEGEDTCLECVATLININFGHNQELMENCRDLYEYAYLVEEVRKGGLQGLSLSESVDRAVDTCINNDILKDFLLRHRAEVKEMMLLEDVELQWKLVKKEARREGLAEGRIFERLTKCLLEESRYKDLERALNDNDYREQLFEEYGIKL